MGDDLAAERLQGRDEDRGRVGAVLRLAQQIHRDDERIRRLVGDDEDLRRSGDQVDPDLPVQLALRLRDVGVARAREEVHALDRLGAEREGRHGLDPAEQVDLVRPAEVHRHDRRGGDLPVDRRRARGDTPHSGDLRRHDRHVGGGDERIPATRDVRAGRRDRDRPLAEEDPGHRLDLEVRQRIALRLGEPADVRLGGPDVVHDLPGKAGDDPFHLLGIEPEPRRGYGRRVPSSMWHPRRAPV